MNPGYLGRSELPTNLRKLFRNVSMTIPDLQLIVQVLLFSQGFQYAEHLSIKIIPFFELCKAQLSSCTHYDFGLRAVKNVLVSAGILQRAHLIDKNVNKADKEEEEGILVHSIRSTLFPKLVVQDKEIAEMYMIFNGSLLKDIFPNQKTSLYEIMALQTEVKRVCDEALMVPNERFIEKIVELYNILQINHGVMVVGAPGSGKSVAWKILVKALQKLDKIESKTFIIDPKTISKDNLYGWADNTTREWTDGVFTKILRDIISDHRGNGELRYWIVFDGDVDPEWIENLNSVLDDNKILTLPNGERLTFPTNVRILFEVEQLDMATPATGKFLKINNSISVWNGMVST